MPQTGYTHSMSRKSVRNIFDSLVRRARREGLLSGKSPRLVWGPASEFPKARNYAYTDGRVVTVAPKMARASAARVRALLAHEIAHVVHQRAGLSHSELETDKVGEYILGERIGYTRKDDVQEAGLKRKRPRYLPK